MIGAPRRISLNDYLSHSMVILVLAAILAVFTLSGSGTGTVYAASAWSDCS